MAKQTYADNVDANGKVLNMIPVKVKNANSDNYDTSFKQISYE